MKLSELLQVIKPLQVCGPQDVEITDIQIDSREVKAGTAFVALPGTKTDGHAFIPKAIAQGGKPAKAAIEASGKIGEAACHSLSVSCPMYDIGKIQGPGRFRRCKITTIFPSRKGRGFFLLHIVAASRHCEERSNPETLMSKVHK